MYTCSGFEYVFFINQGQPLQPGTHVYTNEDLTQPIADGLYNTIDMGTLMYIITNGIIQEGLVDCYS